jgi:anti-anti-sigma factor
MDPTKSKIFVEHTQDVTIVTLNDERILHDEQIKSSSFLGLLVKIHKKMCERKGRLQLCNVDPNLYKIFEITQLNKVLDVSRQSN